MPLEAVRTFYSDIERSIHEIKFRVDDVFKGDEVGGKNQTPSDFQEWQISNLECVPIMFCSSNVN